MVYQIVNIGSTPFFILDIILNARTSYYQQDGEQIFDPKKILKNYLAGMFFVDLISSIPIELMFPGSGFRIINILKLLRVKRLSEVINKMNADDDQKNFMRIIQLIFLMILTMHIVSCFWNYIVIMEEIWIVPLDFARAGQYPEIYQYFGGMDYGRQYFVQMYNSLLFLGGNEMGPRTDFEMFLSSCILIFLACFNAWLFGEMAVLADMQGEKSNNF